MAIDQLRNVADEGVGLFVPFRTAQRGGEYGGDPVGTLAIDAAAVGDSGGGTVTITLDMPKFVFGFHPIFVPTAVVVIDTLSTPEEVRVSFDFRGNERLIGSIIRGVLTLDMDSGLNVGSIDPNGVLIEPDDQNSQQIMLVNWKTNTDARTYELHVFGYMFDAEIMARSGRVSGLLGGVT